MKRVLKWALGLILLGLVIWFEVAYWTSTNDCERNAAAPTNPVKAIVYCDYGLTNLKLQDIEKPVPNDDQLLVRVRAASVNIAGITALQALRDKGKVQSGQKVLINGASGGVGTFAVQIAKSFGADVTGVCSTRNVDLVTSLGADHVIDYTKEDFAKGEQRYDVILDNVANHSLSECRRILTPNGKYVMIGGGGPNDNRWVGPFGRVIKTMVLSPFTRQKMGMMMADANGKDLTILADMMQSGKLKPVIDRTYKLNEVPAAIAYLEEGHARGKVVITVE